MPSPNQLLLDTVSRAATRAVAATAADPANPMNPDAVAETAPELAANIRDTVAADPVVQHLTNTERHWWQKRSMWSTLASAAVFIGTAGHGVFDYLSTHDISDKGLTLSVLVGAAWSGYSAYRAGTALTPLGTSNPSTRYPMNR